MQSMLERLQAKSAENERAARAARSEHPTSKGTKRAAVAVEPVAEPRLPRAAKTKTKAKETAKKSESEDDGPRVAKKHKRKKEADETDSKQEAEESFEEPESPFICLSTALGSDYCLSKADLTSLKVRLVPNPHYRSAAPMQLYDRAGVLAVALAKHGSLEGIAAAAAKREATAAKAAATKEHNDGWRDGANPRSWSPATHRRFTEPFKRSIKAFVMAAHVRKIFGGVDAHAELVKRVVKLVVESREVPTRSKQAAKPPKQRNHWHGSYM